MKSPERSYSVMSKVELDQRTGQRSSRDFEAGQLVKECWIMRKFEDNHFQTWFLLKSSSSRSGYIPSSVALTVRRLSSSYSSFTISMQPRYLIEDRFEQG